MKIVKLVLIAAISGLLLAADECDESRIHRGDTRRCLVVLQ